MSNMAQRANNLQKKIYILHERLQKWAKQLPLPIQQRMSCELLANLASYLLNDPTIYEIVNSLLDIQHIIEKELFRERIEVTNKHIVENRILMNMNLPQEEYEKKKAILAKKHAKEMKEFDVGIIMKLDQKVTEQQMVLETVGLPSFRVTNNPLEIQVQMCVLDFIIRSGKMIYQL
ncbi:UNVERIFIED_CONTAM: hypothetical protein PYX00_007634 [Menopon gallinae]|uniref:Gonadal protein gdl n=1 Tax=Menopon gallinae TaxID=328185 RepID=A0AAW2HKG9_9NEOP